MVIRRKAPNLTGVEKDYSIKVLTFYKGYATIKTDRK